MPENQPNRPSHIIYHVKDTNKLDEKGRQRGIWTRVGAVWPTKSGQGYYGYYGDTSSLYANSPRRNRHRLHYHGFL